jgi:hypothetical protein
MNSRLRRPVGALIIGAACAVAIGALSSRLVSASTTIPGNHSTVNATSHCSGIVGWHFVLPAGGDKPRPTFVSITATFANAGTVTYTGPFTHNGTQTPDNGTGFTTPSNDTLLSATAQANGADAGDFFVLSGIICGGTPPTPTPTPRPTPTPTPTPSQPA